MIRWTVVLVLVASLLSACTRRNPDACCTTVTECQQNGFGDIIQGCADGKVCSQGACIPPQCTTSDQCAVPTSSCVGGVCVAPDALDASPPRIGYIAFVSNRDGNNEIYRMRTDGSEQINLTQNAADDSSPLWDPTGEHIAFLSNRTGGVSQLFIIRLDGTGLINVSQGQATSPVWSPDGLSLAFVSTRNGGTNIFSVRAAGGTVTPLTTTGTAATPDWSRDGARIAYIDSSNIWVMDSNGLNAANLMVAALTPKWSPDGTRIALVARNFGVGGYDIAFIRPDGMGFGYATTTAGINESAQQWSPDGTRLVGQTSQNEIFLVDASTLAYTNVTMSSAIDNSPSWSADSPTKILFSSDRSGDVDVYLVQPGAGSPTNLTNKAGFSDTSAVWRPL
jgi:Tol biopolymer transport system component